MAWCMTDPPVPRSRGRKPTLLYVRTRDRLVVAADVRVSAIDIVLCDFAGEQIARESLPPVLAPDEFIREFPKFVNALLKKHRAAELCEGIGIVVPGMADRQAGRVISAPLLGWRDVEIGPPVAKATGLPVVVESAGKACALAHMWLTHDDMMNTQDFIYITVSDGVGTGLVVDGKVVSGHGGTAGEFGHMAINLDGPRCACGSNGCWMAYISDRATSARYAASLHSKPAAAALALRTIISLAHSGNVKATAALQTTARYLGLGLANILHGIDPACVYIGGEITAAWDIVEPVDARSHRRACSHRENRQRRDSAVQGFRSAPARSRGADRIAHLRGPQSRLKATSICKLSGICTYSQQSRSQHPRGTKA